MALLTAFTIAWCLALWYFKNWFSEGFASSVLAIVFGILSLYCVFFGDALKALATRLDNSIVRRLPNARIVLRILVPAAPDLVLLVLLIICFNATLCLAALNLFEDMLHGGELVLRGDFRTQLLIISIIVWPIIIGGSIPPLLMYGFILVTLHRRLSFKQILGSSMAGAALAHLSISIVRGNWWFLKKDPIFLLLMFIFSTFILSTVVVLGRTLGIIVLRRNEA